VRIINQGSLLSGTFHYLASSSSPSFITGSGSQFVVLSVNPTPTSIVATVSGGVLTLSWRADHTGWILQTQTNSLSTGLGPQLG